LRNRVVAETTEYDEILGQHVSDRTVNGSIQNVETRLVMLLFCSLETLSFFRHESLDHKKGQTDGSLSIFSGLYNLYLIFREISTSREKRVELQSFKDCQGRRFHGQLSNFNSTTTDVSSKFSLYSDKKKRNIPDPGEFGFTTEMEFIFSQ
jgi:hypothetical protein